MSQTHYKWNNILKYLFLKFTKKVHITTHLLFGFFVSSSLWGSRAQLGIGNGVGEMRMESMRWEELWSWGLGEKRCGYEKRHHHYPVVELLIFWFVPSQVTSSLKSIEIKLWIWVSYRVIHQWFQSTITGVYEKIVELVRRD